MITAHLLGGPWDSKVLYVPDGTHHVLIADEQWRDSPRLFVSRTFPVEDYRHHADEPHGIAAPLQDGMYSITGEPSGGHAMYTWDHWL